MKWRDIVIAWDFAGGALTFVLVGAFMSPQIPNEFAQEIYNTAISVLSIVFSIYFAALATIASASDDDFIKFLEEDGTYGVIVAAFRFTLGLLFAALLASLLAYVVTAYSESTDKGGSQSKWWLAAFGWLAVWSLLATYISAGDSIRYATARMRFLRIKKASVKPDDQSD